jgi:hypothetical protein
MQSMVIIEQALEAPVFFDYQQKKYVKYSAQYS